MMEEEWYERPSERGEDCDETVYYEAEKDETMYYDAEAEETVYFEAETDETVYYEAEDGGPPENVAEPRELAEKTDGYDMTPAKRGAYEELSAKRREFGEVTERGQEYEGAPDTRGTFGEHGVRGEEYEGAPGTGGAFNKHSEGGEYEGAPGSGGAFNEHSEGGEYEGAPGTGGAFNEHSEGGEYEGGPGTRVVFDELAESEESEGDPDTRRAFDEPSDAPPEDRRKSFLPYNKAQAPGMSAENAQALRARPRSFMAQMASMLLKRRGCRGRASVERYKEARNLKRKTAARAKRSELNKICWALSKAADESEAEEGWAERQTEKIRAWRKDREAKPDWTEKQAAFLVEWRESQNDYALRQYKRALSQAGVFRAFKRPTLGQQVAALAAYRARKKEEAFHDARLRPWAQNAGGQAAREDVVPNSPQAAINQFLAGFSPMHMLPPALWFQPPFKPPHGLLPTPRSTQPNLSKAAVEQVPAPVNPVHVAPQAPWHEAPQNVNRVFQEPPKNFQPNPQTIRRDLAPGSEHVPPYPVHTRPHASWHQPQMNVNRGLPPNPWC